MKFLVKVKVKGEELSGILIKEDDEFITLKLSSGYNSNFRKSEIEILHKENVEKEKGVVNKVKLDKSLPKIVILHTGGTIASKVDYATGAVSWKFEVAELLALFPELNDIAYIEPLMIRNMASDDMRFEHYNVMIDEIRKAIDSGASGVVITHGTDTLHYTSAALQYALKSLPIPVILVGAQRSSDRPSSDAFSNLFNVVKFIVMNSGFKKAYRRVGICMHESSSDDKFVILDGLNVKKLHSSRRDAFKQINYLPVAVLKNDEIEILREELFVEDSGGFSYTKFDSSLKIGFLKVHPNMFADEIKMYESFDAVVVEATGLGHMPITEIDEFTKEHLKILNALRKLISKGVKVIIGVQTVYGEVNLNVYSPGRVLNDTGVLGNQMNLITETLFCRVAHVLSKDRNDFEKIWKENLEEFEIRGIDICEHD